MASQNKLTLGGVLLNTVRVSKIRATPEILMAALSCGEAIVYIVYSLHSDKAEVCSFLFFTVFGLRPVHLLFPARQSGCIRKGLSFSQAPQCTRFQLTFGPASLWQGPRSHLPSGWPAQELHKWHPEKGTKPKSTVAPASIPVPSQRKPRNRKHI